MAISDRYKKHSIGKRPPKDHSHHLNMKLLSSCWTIELWGSANQIALLALGAMLNNGSTQKPQTKE